jgi:hypothetical protein
MQDQEGFPDMLKTQFIIGPGRRYALSADDMACNLTGPGEELGV